MLQELQHILIGGIYPVLPAARYECYAQSRIVLEITLYEMQVVHYLPVIVAEIDDVLLPGRYLRKEPLHRVRLGERGFGICLIDPRGYVTVGFIEIFHHVIVLIKIELYLDGRNGFFEYL